MKTKKIHIAIIIGIALGNTAPAFTADLPWCEITDCTTASHTVDLVENCYEKTSRCYYDSVVYTCRKCNNLSNQTTKYTTLSSCQGTVEYTTCCVPCGTCLSDANWSSAGGGYEKKTTRTCDCNAGCQESTTYRCAAGYYGSPSSAASGCSACPGGGTSAAGSTSITNCYVTSFSDSTGSGTYTSSCYYSN